LAAATVYCIISTTTDRFKISTTCGGAEVDITTSGTGTQSDHFNFVTPDTRGRFGLGTGTAVYTDAGVDADVDITANDLTVPSNNTKWITGTPVVFTLTSGTITGLTSGNTYYVIRSSATKIQLASSLANAQNLTPIDFTAKSSPIWNISHTNTARTIGEIGGEQEHAQNVTELLAHIHGTVRVPGGTASVVGGVDNIDQTGSTGSTGGNAAMNVMNPFLVMTYIIKL
jgi:microcystin-dependent protein